MKNRPSRFSLWLIPFAIFLLAGATGYAQEKSSEDIDRTIKLIGKEYKFEPDQFTVKSGNTVQIVFKNKGTIAHDFHIKELDLKTEPIQPGNQVTYTFTAPDTSKTIHFECKVAGHGPAGMKGSINVQSGKSSPSGGEKKTNDQSSQSNKSSSNEGQAKENSSLAEKTETSFHKRISTRRKVPLKKGWGAIRGTVKLSGEKPGPYKNKGSEAFQKQCGFDGAFEIQYVHVHEKTNGIQDTLVYVKDVDATHQKLLPPKTTRIVQRDCRFSPSVQVVRTGGTLTLINEDPAVHNFNYKPTAPLNNTKGNLIQKQGKNGPKKDKIKIGTSDVYTSKCNVHPWMNGLFLAVDHHAYDVTGDKGQFKIQLPPGQYELKIRHYTQKKAKTIKVTIPEGSTKSRDVKLSLE